jgi:hypothetical protein
MGLGRPDASVGESGRGEVAIGEGREPPMPLPLRLSARLEEWCACVVLDPLDLIARLCALIPLPRCHMLRYHGVLAAHAKARPEVVPGPEPKSAEPTQIPLSLDGAASELERIAKQSARYPWTWPDPTGQLELYFAA